MADDRQEGCRDGEHDEGDARHARLSVQEQEQPAGNLEEHHRQDDDRGKSQLRVLGERNRVEEDLEEAAAEDRSAQKDSQNIVGLDLPHLFPARPVVISTRWLVPEGSQIHCPGQFINPHPPDSAHARNLSTW
jgi:hypothetical protein